jgi:hypothetical protein
MQTRSHNFLQRVAIERRVLQLVNKHGIGVVPLAGLTHPAIHRWADQFCLDSRPQAEIALLVEISMRLRVDADKSKQVFDSKPVPNSLVELADELEVLLCTAP